MTKFLLECPCFPQRLSYQAKKKKIRLKKNFQNLYDFLKIEARKWIKKYNFFLKEEKEKSKEIFEQPLIFDK